MKTVLISGGNSGIGKATTSRLTAMGYQVVFLARSKTKAEAVKNEIISSSGSKNIDYILVDLTSKKEVRECVATFKQKYEKLDVLINNAGVCLPEKRITVDGMEESFEINHLSHFILSNLLLDLLKKSDDPRIINVSSAAHSSGRFDPDNLQSEKSFSYFSTYSDTKLLNILFTFELAERLKDTRIKVNALHPGVVSTNFGHELKGLWPIMLSLGKLFLLSPEKGAETSVYLATSDEVKNITGKYFVKCKPVETKNAYITVENRKILWEKSLQLSVL
jgi:NAD(P)-dependent dehydrogenase (short-subunit alcohol dehydrogenase family)